MQILSNYIGCEYVAPHSGRYLENYNPATGEVSGQTPDSDAGDVDVAVKAAQAAFAGWSAWTPERRHDVLQAISAGIMSRLDELAEAESSDSGKTVQTARNVDIPRAALNFKFFATAAMQFSSESHEMPGALSYTLRRPIGVVGCISPWNLPLYLFTWKIAPALAAGNCVIGKPSEVTPLTAYLLADICREAGLPPGVLNIVHGTGATTGEAIVRHPEVKAISFTGSTRAGAEIARIAAPMFKKLSLELGGKNPTLIFADCDYEAMLEAAVRSSFNNQGQICLCGSRLYIERPLYERFRADYTARVSALRVGDPTDSQNHLGALVSKAHFDKVLGHIRTAVEEGGQILCGGHAIDPGGRFSGGWYVAPTVIEGLPIRCSTNQEEIFGPVTTIQPFDTDEEALNLANDVRYGLSATVWTQNLRRAHRLAAELQAGIVWINAWMLRDLRTPFGGMKHSGIGREGGWEAMRFFTEPKNVTIGS